MSRAPRAQRPLVTALLLVAAAASGSEGVAPATPARAMPACALSPLGDAPAPDLARLRGQVIYVDFWASWCAPCAKAFPFLNRLEREFRGQGLHVVGINVDEKAADATAFLARHPAVFELAADAAGQCPRAFGVKAMPSSYLVDRQGVIRHVHLGFAAQDAAQLRRKVRDLLQE